MPAWRLLWFSGTVSEMNWILLCEGTSPGAAMGLSNLQHLWFSLIRFNLICSIPIAVSSRAAAVHRTWRLQPFPQFTVLLSAFQESEATLEVAWRPQTRMNHADSKHVSICLAGINASGAPVSAHTDSTHTPPPSLECSRYSKGLLAELLRVVGEGK